MAAKKFECVLSAEQIKARVVELGQQLTREYQGTQVVLVGVLNGAFIFMADLARAIDLDLEIDFVRAASYGAGTESCGRISLTKDVELSLAGKDVILVEDIIDTGRTLACLKEYVQQRSARSVKVCALIDKRERREVEVEADYVGFEVKEGFLVGYGLDCAEQYRQLPGVYHLTMEKD